MNTKRYLETLENELMPTVHSQFPDEICRFQDGGAPCHRAEAVKEWLAEKKHHFTAAVARKFPRFKPHRKYPSLAVKLERPGTGTSWRRQHVQPGPVESPAM
ncbi:hypothetical protein LDENG_00238150 [Lucifuga dentata]|nr:hypothetical protein LDENG_00238150 [Lucifuga dentata]